MSSPLWGRGLKCKYTADKIEDDRVVPLVGTWIEMLYNGWNQQMRMIVVPLVGTWIEIIYKAPTLTFDNLSSPLWGRGLKFCRASCHENLATRRPPCGDVD